MSQLINFNLNELAYMSDKELAKQLKKIAQILESKQKCEDVSKWENLYWALQTERLKRLKGKNY